MASRNQNSGDQQAPLERLIRLSELQTIIPLSKAGIYNAINEGRLPKPVKLGSRAIAFKESSIRAYLDGLGKGEE